ncbi:MAG: hypothetical protein KGJ62_01760 [Armatimonadetes bacterium]|nr:hypothetical protein [Armatimonadota bacterium]MDE2205504.1 hypothetical protein [Armatimonadota bacterium]
MSGSGPCWTVRASNAKQQAAAKGERAGKHKPTVSHQRPRACKPQVDSRTSDDLFWVFADPLVCDTSMCGDEDEGACRVVLTSEAMARAAERNLDPISEMVAHEAAWSEIQAIAEKQCRGRWRIFWVGSAEPIDVSPVAQSRISDSLPPRRHTLWAAFLPGR